jgi:hypothetical protein
MDTVWYPDRIVCRNLPCGLQGTTISKVVQETDAKQYSYELSKNWRCAFQQPANDNPAALDAGAAAGFGHTWEEGMT